MAAIVGASMLAAVLYGIAQDNITARICLEYFTVGHIDVGLRHPSAVALFWGVVATWWVGLGLGIPLALAAQVGSWPTRSARALLRPIALLMGATGLTAVVFGIIGGALAASGAVVLSPHLASRIDPSMHVRFLIDGWAHAGAYAAGALGGIVLIVHTLRRRIADARSG